MNVQLQTILVVPYWKKKGILLNNALDKKITFIKCITLEELMKNLTIQPKKEAIYYLMKDLHLSYSLSTIYLDNLSHITYIEESEHENVQKLLEIKQFLKENNLLEENQFFQNYIKDKKIRIEGYILTKEQKNILNKIGKNVSIDIIETVPESYTHPLYEFETIDDEVSFIASDIVRNLQNGISIQKIYLANVTEEYYHPLVRIFRMFKLPLESFENHTIYGNTLVKKWLKGLEEDYEYSLETLVNDLHTEEDYKIYEKLVQIYNEYVMVPKDEFWLNCIIELCKRTMISGSKKQNVIRFKNIRIDDFSSNEIVYMVGMNQENIPRVKQDENYLSDVICKYLNIDTTLDLNEREKILLIQKINAIPNCILTYKRKTPFETYYPSSLLQELQIQRKRSNCCYQYANRWNKLKLAHLLDRYYQYNEKDSNLEMLYTHYNNFSYNTYDNQYHPIPKEKLKVYLEDKLTLSYTSLDHFYRCQFRYYVGNILKLNSYEETFAQQIGNLFHYFLSHAFQQNFDFENEWKSYHQKMHYTAKEIFFLKKLKKELYFVIDTIKEQNTHTSLIQEEYEQRIFKSISGDSKVTFVGIVDKIKYQEEDGIIYAAIIDYKTGSLETNLNQSIYGIGMQLPIYLYLLHNKKEWNHVKIVGFYLQKMIQDEIINDEDKDYLRLKKDYLRLEGYSSDNPSMVKRFDDTYLDSRVIKGMKVSSKGFYAYSKVMSEHKMNKLVELVGRKIEEASSKILNSDFQINPKQIGSKLVGCEFCAYHDLCFQTSKDIVYLHEYKKLEFLEGEVL